MSIYLDNSATTKIRAEALKKYCEVSEGIYGNPSSLHAMGHLAEKQLDEARHLLLLALGERSGEVVFTASGSEANNLAIIGRAHSKDRYKKKGAKIITTDGEHASVSAPIEHLRREGFTVVNIPTGGGAIDMQALERELTPDVILVSIMMVNNETGALYDTASVAALMRVRSPEALLHVDATQSFLKLPFRKRSVGADMITVSSHKIEGPKGVGALVIDEKVIKQKGLAPLILGGGQEGGLRSGTENVPGIAAFGEAIRLGSLELKDNYRNTLALRDKLVEEIEKRPGLSEISITNPKMHAPHILNITLPNIKSETMLHFLSAEDIFVSSGSACSSNGGHSSLALLAYGRSEAEADCSIRISLSGRNTEDDIEAFLSALERGIVRLSRIRK